MIPEAGAFFYVKRAFSALNILILKLPTSINA